MSFFQIKRVINFADACELANDELSKLAEQLLQDAQQSRKFCTFISTDVSGKRIFIQSMQFQRIFVIKDIIQNSSRPVGLFSVLESIQISSSDSQPIIEVMTNILQFLCDTVIIPTNRDQIQLFLALVQNWMPSEGKEQMPEAWQNHQK